MFYVVLGIVTVLLGSLAYAAASGAPWVPTKKGDLKRIECLLQLQSGERFVELGCGNGRVCQYLAQKNPGAEVHGVELSLLQYFVAWVQNRLTRSKIRFYFQNIFHHDLSDYDAVYLFLMPETYQKIQPKLKKELRPGARVVTYVWPIPGWEPVEIDHEEGALDLYLYCVPVSGMSKTKDASLPHDPEQGW